MALSFASRYKKPTESAPAPKEEAPVAKPAPAPAVAPKVETPAPAPAPAKPHWSSSLTNDELKAMEKLAYGENTGVPLPKETEYYGEGKKFKDENEYNKNLFKNDWWAGTPYEKGINDYFMLENVPEDKRLKTVRGVLNEETNIYSPADKLFNVDSSHFNDKYGPKTKNGIDLRNAVRIHFEDDLGLTPSQKMIEDYVGKIRNYIANKETLPSLDAPGAEPKRFSDDEIIDDDEFNEIGDILEDQEGYERRPE